MEERTTGRNVVEVYGPESSGRTTLTLHTLANARKLGGSVAFIDSVAARVPRAEIEGEMATRSV